MQRPIAFLQRAFDVVALQDPSWQSTCRAQTTPFITVRTRFVAQVRLPRTIECFAANLRIADNPDIKSLCVRGMEIKPHDWPRRYAAGHDFEACPQKG